MLNVWVNYPKQHESVLNDVDFLFTLCADYRVIDSDLGRRIVRETSRVTEIANYTTMWADNGLLISPEKLSEGAKVLLLMLSEKARKRGFIFNYAFCGENCDKFLEEISDVYNINLFLGRRYVPSVNYLEKSGVLFMESGRIVHTREDYIDEYSSLSIDCIETLGDNYGVGTHTVVIETPEICYDIKITRKFTTIIGDSGTGRSYLRYLLCRGYDDLDMEVSYRSELKARALESANMLDACIRHGFNLILIDENLLARVYMKGKGAEFAKKLRESQVCFLIMSRLKYFSPAPIGTSNCFTLETQRSGDKLIKTLLNVEAQQGVFR